MAYMYVIQQSKKCSDFTFTLLEIKLKIVSVKRRLWAADQGKM